MRPVLTRRLIRSPDRGDEEGCFCEMMKNRMFSQRCLKCLSRCSIEVGWISDETNPKSGLLVLHNIVVSIKA